MIAGNKPIFRLLNLNFSFGSELVLNGLNLDIYRGETFLVVGPGGSGKSTLLKMMSGLLKPQMGHCYFDGEEISKLPRRQRHRLSRRIGMTFQRSGLFDSLSAGENLSFPLQELTKDSPLEIERKIKTALDEVGLSGLEETMVYELSGGMQKRLGIARAIILSPEVILYDDPTAGLDPVTSRSILDLILETQKKHKMTIVVVSSDLAAAQKIASIAKPSRLGFLYRGDFLQIGESKSFRESQNPVVYQFFHGLLEGPLSLDREV